MKSAQRRQKFVSILKNSFYYSYLVIIGGWLIFPMVFIIIASFGKSEGPSAILSLSINRFSFDSYFSIPASYWHSLRLTVELAFLGTLIALAVTIPAAWALARGRIKGRRFISNAVLIPSVVPRLLLGIAMLVFFLPLGLANNFWGLLLALLALNLAYGYRFSEAVVEGIDPEVEEQARSLGASWFFTFFRISLPLMGPGIIIAALFIFMFDLMTFLLLYFIAGPFASPISVRLFADFVNRGIMPYGIATAAILVYIAAAFYCGIAITLGAKYLTGVVFARKG